MKKGTVIEAVDAKRPDLKPIRFHLLYGNVFCYINTFNGCHSLQIREMTFDPSTLGQKVKTVQEFGGGVALNSVTVSAMTKAFHEYESGRLERGESVVLYVDGKTAQQKRIRFVAAQAGKLDDTNAFLYVIDTNKGAIVQYKNGGFNGVVIPQSHWSDVVEHSNAFFKFVQDQEEEHALRVYKVLAGKVKPAPSPKKRQQQHQSSSPPPPVKVVIKEEQQLNIDDWQEEAWANEN